MVITAGPNGAPITTATRYRIGTVSGRTSSRYVVIRSVRSDITLSARPYARRVVCHIFAPMWYDWVSGFPPHYDPIPHAIYYTSCPPPRPSSVSGGSLTPVGLFPPG